MLKHLSKSGFQRFFHGQDFKASNAWYAYYRWVVVALYACWMAFSVAQGVSYLTLWLVAGTMMLWTRHRIYGLILGVMAMVSQPAWQLPLYIIGSPLSLTVKVVELLPANAVSQRFVVEVTKSDAQQYLPGCAPDCRIAVYWHQREHRVDVNQRWRLSLRLKPLHGLANPYASNSERYQRLAGYVARATVVPSGETVLLEAGKQPYRRQIKQAIWQLLQTRPHGGLMYALVSGDREHLEPATTELFRRTGVSHLLAISGLHLGILFVVLRRFARICLRLLSWDIVAPATVWADLFVGSLLAGYGWFVGWSASVQRVLLMVALLFCSDGRSRLVVPWHALCVVFTVVVTCQPSVVFNPGLWLSFGAVGALMSTPSLPLKGLASKAWALVGVQGRLTLIMLPVTLWFFHQIPLLGLIANLFAIPAMSVLIPGLFATTVLSLMGVPTNLFLSVISAGFSWLGSGLALLDTSWSLLHVGQTDVHRFAIAMLGVFWWAARVPCCRYILLLTSLLPLLYQPSIPMGQAVLTIFDVGQGLSVLIRTHRHTLLFDLGPSTVEYAAANRSVVPYLMAHQVRRLDKVVISHWDNDHAGGLPSVSQHFAIADIIAPPHTDKRVVVCQAGQGWIWDGVEFALLHPQEHGHTKDRNNQSCVLRVKANHHIVLLPGDIEAKAERDLLRMSAAHLKADLIIAPHHGSISSSSQAFVEAVAPGWVIFSTGFMNRYRFPHPKIVQRYHAQGAQSLDTARSGAIELSIGQEGPIRPYTWRARWAPLRRRSCCW